MQLVEISECMSGETSREFYVMFRDLFSKRGVLNDCTHHIPKFLKDAGFDRVKAQRYELCIGGPPDSEGINAKARESFAGANKRMLSTVVTLGIRTEGEYKEMVDDLEREWKNNAQSKSQR